MNSVKLSAEVLLFVLGEQGRGISLARVTAALRYILPISGDKVDFDCLSEKLFDSEPRAPFVGPLWQSASAENSGVTYNQMLAAFGTRALSLYANEIGVGVRFSIECLARALWEFVNLNREVDNVEPMLDLMTLTANRQLLREQVNSVPGA